MQERFEQRLTRTVNVGEVPIGSGYPVVVQSMITENIQNTIHAARQIKSLHLNGAKIVRIAIPTLKDAQSLADRLGAL